MIQASTGTNSPALGLGVLSNIPLLRGLSRAELARIRGYLRMCSFPAGADLLTLGQPGELAYFILSGRVKLYAEDDNGDEVVLAILGPGEVLGEMSLVDRASRSVGATTMEESTLAWLDRAAFRECVQCIPALARNLVGNLSRRLQAAHSRIMVLATESVSARVAYQILALAREQGEALQGGGVRIPVRLTQADLAKMVGTTRVSVNQAMVGLRERGIISTGSGYFITVHDLDSLAGDFHAGGGGEIYMTERRTGFALSPIA